METLFRLKTISAVQLFVMLVRNLHRRRSSTFLQPIIDLANNIYFNFKSHRNYTTVSI
jgi:hypothetical protein